MKKINKFVLITILLLTLCGCAKKELLEEEKETYLKIFYLDPTDLDKKCDKENSVSKTGIKKGCMKWYAYSKNGDEYQLILDHNTSSESFWDDASKNLLKDTADWDKSLNTRLITANEVARIIGNDTFNQDTSTSKEWFYFDNNSQNKVSSSSNKSKYAWLFDYTNGCLKYGCEFEEKEYVYGYWTNSEVKGEKNLAWFIHRVGDMASNFTDSKGGIRPVITIKDKGN